MATTIRACIYARGEVSFAKFLFLPNWFAKLLEAKFSHEIDAKLICQTVEAALRRTPNRCYNLQRDDEIYKMYNFPF
jgi:hypothetical protein